MNKKKCNICGIEKLLNEYPKDRTLKTGYRGKCKKCSNKQCKEYYSCHKKEIAKRYKKYCSLDTTKNRVNNYMKHRRKNDLNFRIKDNLRRRINYAIMNSKKSTNTSILLGCSVKEFRIYIENLWLDGMNWDNYGMFGWHLDHIKPCASFDLTDPEQQKICFHYTNIQPLWAKDNWSKGAK